MSITVATVALNAAADLPATLESVLAQDHDDLEVLVVDGSSTDDTAEVLAAYGDDIRVEVVEDSGIFDAMNRAAAVASKETILFMNAGDRFFTGRSLAKLWARRHAATDIAYGDHVYRSGGVDTLKRARDMEEHVAALRAGEVSWAWLDGFPAHQATLTRTDLLRRLRYDTALRMAADHDFLMRAEAEGALIQYVDEVVCLYAGGGATDRRRERTSRELNAIYRVLSERPDRVDELFFAGASPFLGQRSPLSGDALAGLLPPDEGETVRWASGRGVRFRSPVHQWSEALMLEGRSDAPRQVLEAVVDGQTVATTVLAEGEFSRELAFAPPLPPGTVVDLVPGTALRRPGRPELVSVALSDFAFRFVEAPAPLALGELFETNLSGGRAATIALVGGWWGPERTHVWSKSVGELRLVCDERVGAVAVTAFGNPVLEGQRVALAVNDVPAGEMALAKTPTTHVFEIGDSWRFGGAENRLRLTPSAVARVGGDPRSLGFGLCNVMLR